VSNPITYDSLLVHYLAAELDDRLRARRLRRVRFDSEHRRFTLELDGERLVWELHPARGWIRVIPGTGSDPSDGPGHRLPQEATEGWGGRRIGTRRRPRVRRVTAPPDERLLDLEIDAGGADRASRFVVELMTNQWNVLALAPDGRILSALRAREAGGRVLRPGQEYAPPSGQDPRRGLDQPLDLGSWLQLFRGVGPRERMRTLIRSVAWTSPLNARAILGQAASPAASGRAAESRDSRRAAESADPDRAAESRSDPHGPAESLADPGRLEAAWERYRALAVRPEARPHLLRARGRAVPYPLPLPGIPGSPMVSLLAAFQAVIDEGARNAPGILAPEVRSALEDRLERIARRAERLHAEAEAAPTGAMRLRHQADVLMARLGEVEKGATRVDLEDFDGTTITVELDPALSGAENAEVLYDRARKRERAAERLPARVRDTLAERNHLERLLETLDAGEADPEAVRRWLEEVRPATQDQDADGERLPYHRFRSSGGLEIRVGRSGRANDDLTFRHSSPDDIWLHARDAAGAHVILRWTDRDQNPPQRDLLEAAILAAVRSRARTSGTVPVDWTRRKYVRKPRKAPPGAVIPERVSTVFVEPDPGIEGRLRREGGQ
jgi:predicted ribosome quality control (RQC) complex YloA/Tae2 family protein